MKKMTVIVTLVLIAAFAVGSAFAVPPGKTVELAGGDAGKVTFVGKTHADAGKKCNDCHPKVFQMKKGSTKITMKDINEGKSCGICHNGKDAFDAKAEDSCAKCHVK